MTVEIRSASAYSTQQLVDIYNLTRSDYLVPMPMVAAQLEEYLHVYDIALDGSVVGLLDGQPVGLNLLGVRGDQGWVTRLGVAFEARRQGVARALMEALLIGARVHGVQQMWLEVIAENDPGIALFESFGFSPVGELMVAERSNTAPTTIPASQVLIEPIGRDEILGELARRDGHVDWKNHFESLSKLEGLSGIKVVADRGSAWVAFRPKDGHLQKTILGVDSGLPGLMGWIALHHLGQMKEGFTLKAENVPAQGEIWDAYQRAGFQISFRRIEMALSL